jgi:hypothetical protein
MKLILIVTVIGSLTCLLRQEAVAQTANSSPFLDSIAEQDELSIEQIKSHTSIDSVYYSGRFSRAGFTGDTVFHFSNGFIGAIITHDDRMVCVSKFLLIFRPSDYRNTASGIVNTDCDKDGSSAYNKRRYKLLLSESMFETIQSYYPRGSDKPNKVYRTKWKVTDKGTVVQVK